METANAFATFNTGSTELPSRRGNQLNGNYFVRKFWTRHQVPPLSQGKPIEWKLALIPLPFGFSCSLPSRRGNQLNGNLTELLLSAILVLKQLPSRRGNQLNGNASQRHNHPPRATTPLSQGKPIEWKLECMARRI